MLYNLGPRFIEQSSISESTLSAYIHVLSLDAPLVQFTEKIMTYIFLLFKNLCSLI